MNASPPMATGIESPVEAHLRDYVRVILKRRWAVLGLFGSVVLAAVLYLLMQPAMYESTVSLLVEPSGPNVMSKVVEEVYIPTNVSIDYYKTQYELLKSHQTLQQTARRLDLKSHREYARKPLGMLASRWEGIKTTVALLASTIGHEPSDVSESEAERRLVDDFREHITVKPVPNSRIVRVTVESVDPHLAAEAANTIASVYITRSLEMKIGASEEASRWIAARVDELRRKVEHSERTLHDFASRYGLVSVDDRKRLVTQKLGDLNTQLVQAETKRVEAEARFKQLESVMGNSRVLESSAEVLSSVLIQNLRAQEMQMAQKVAELGEKYGPKHPAMVQATSELRELQAGIQAEVKKVYASLKAEYEVAQARERVIRNALNQQKADVMAAGQHEVQYGILEREVQSNRQLYEMFLKRMKETDIATEIRTSNIYVADPGIVSLVPVKPKKIQTMFLATLLGLAGGVGFAFFLEYMDSTIKSPEDIAQHLPGLAFLGFLPVFTPPTKTSHGVDLATHQAPQSLFAEHLRTIRTGLILSAADKPPTSFLVTSATEAEGKSVFSANLAIAFTQLGRPTVLIEGDFRKPRLQSVFGLNLTRGLSHYLVGEAELHEIMVSTPVPYLKIIPCGAIPPNPAELLQSQRMQDLLESFQKEQIYTVVDCSPVLAVTDPVIVGHRVDGVILVVRAAHTTRQTARMAARVLRDGKIKILGVVLQRLKARELSAYYGSYYKKYYGKYYGRTPDKSLMKRIS
ncbi:MAG: polysaccharide biosynthesis tyrosine autokinase [Nitrospiraceae bacterium]|nr:polysaccharide biosynthesis tyrosine autokinase [Nitrospiraceae bacterium]